MSIRSLAGSVILLGFLGACASIGADVGSVKQLPVTGSNFDKALFDQYVGRAEREAAEGDYRSANLFLDKARPAASGTLVPPEEPENWRLPGGALGELGPARARLLKALDGNARSSLPKLAARAQLLYDCWVEEWSENIQPKDIAACRSAFGDAMAKIEAAMKPKPVAQPAPPPPEPEPAPPQPFDREVIERYIVYFDFDSSAITAKARGVIAEAAASIAGAKSYTFGIRGHTDRAGSDAYNERLAEARAGAVEQALREAGIPAATISKDAFGEQKPVIPTNDGVREQANRRVEIFIEKVIVVTPTG